MPVGSRRHLPPHAHREGALLILQDEKNTPTSSDKWGCSFYIPSPLETGFWKSNVRLQKTSFKFSEVQKLLWNVASRFGYSLNRNAGTIPHWQRSEYTFTGTCTKTRPRSQQASGTTTKPVHSSWIVKSLRRLARRHLRAGATIYSTLIHQSILPNRKARIDLSVSRSLVCLGVLRRIKSKPPTGPLPKIPTQIEGVMRRSSWR